MPKIDIVSRDRLRTDIKISGGLNIDTVSDFETKLSSDILKSKLFIMDMSDFEIITSAGILIGNFYFRAAFVACELNHFLNSVFLILLYAFSIIFLH